MINQLFIFLILGLRPLLGPARCKFAVSCSNFAVLQLKEKNLFVAIFTITKRLLLCSPLYRFTQKLN